ncbi:MAG: ATP-binding protein [Pseudomonadota bacterium]
MALDTTKLNFDKCEDEPIHIPEAIQGYGYLFALDPTTGSVKIHSANVDGIFRLNQPSDLQDKIFFDFLDTDAITIDFIQESFERARCEDLRLPLQLRFKQDMLADAEHKDYHAVIFCSDDLMIIEIEPAPGFKSMIKARQFGTIYAMNIAPTFQSLETVEGVTDAIARIIKDLTSFERVVVYRFNDDGSGTVVGEAKDDEIESYLNFYYPSTDIPPQARKLYEKNWIRINPNVDIAPVPLLPDLRTARRAPLDMTRSLLRSMSPIHVQYIRNQGLKSSMSISLIQQGRLWGLVSCHHRTAHYIPQNIRLECESLGHLFGWQIYAKQEEIQYNKKVKLERTFDDLLEKLSHERTIIEIFQDNQQQILKLMGACGFIFFAGSDTVSIGETPAETKIDEIISLARKTSPENIYSSHNLPKLLGDTADLNGICGALVIPILSQKNYFTAWFRAEHQHVIKWAGKPEEKSVASDKQARLSPRTSFVIHTEEVTGESLPWKEEDTEIADRFNKLFLRHAFQRNIEMQANISMLREKDKTKDEFLATLAHELRNPLAPITSSITLLKNSTDEEIRSKAHQIIDRQLKLMVTLVDDLLDVSRITRGKIRLVKKPIALNRVVESAIETNALILQEKNHKLHFNSEQLLYVNGDFNRLTQIFANIIHNAVKYTDPNGVISVDIKHEDGEGVVSVSDNGMGIPKHYLSRIFDMFTQVDANSTQTRGGLGIGLTLVKSLVALHGGRISVKSRGVGMGSSFSVSLPATTHIKAALLQAEPERADTEVGSLRILVVDDNVDAANSLQLLLKTMGHEVFVRIAGHDAIKDFSEIKPDLALLDIGMPGIDGYELCYRLKNLDVGGDTIFVALTGWGQIEHKTKSQAAGFNRHLVKPLTMDTMMKMFEDFFGKEADLL